MEINTVLSKSKHTLTLIRHLSVMRSKMIQIKALNKDSRVINASGLSTNTHRYTEASSAGKARFPLCAKGCFVEGLENKHLLLSIPLFKQAFKS